MMKQIQEQTALNPLHSHWRLADDRNVLYLSPTGETDAEKTVELSPEQAGRIREITAITSSLLITLLIEKQVTAVHLVGRKIITVNGLAAWQPGLIRLPSRQRRRRNSLLPSKSYQKQTQSLRYWIVGEKSVDLIGYAKSTRA